MADRNMNEKEYEATHGSGDIDRDDLNLDLDRSARGATSSDVHEAYSKLGHLGGEARKQQMAEGEIFTKDDNER